MLKIMKHPQWATLLPNFETIKMRRTFAVILTLALGLFQAQAQESLYTVTSGDVTLTVDAARGGKILSFKHGDKEVISQVQGFNSFGSTFWTSPQKVWNWPPVAEFDRLPYTVEEKDGHVILTSQVPKRLPYRIVKDIRPGKPGSVVITYTIVNESDSEQSVAPWEITRVPADGTVFFDAPLEGITPAGLMDFKDAHSLSWYTIDQAPQNRKINADGKGWYAFAGNGLLLIKSFEDIDPSQSAPEEAEIQVYVDMGHAFVELECQGEYKTLQSGESLSWTVTWYLVPQKGDVPSKALAKLVRKTLRSR